MIQIEILFGIGCVLFVAAAAIYYNTQVSVSHHRMPPNNNFRADRMQFNNRNVVRFERRRQIEQSNR